MFLGNPLLPINVPVDEALSKLSALLLEKNWNEIEIGTPKLTLVPFYSFNYHYFTEEDKGSSKVVTSSKDGFLSFDAITLKIDEGMGKLLSSSKDKIVNEISLKEFVEKEMKIEKREVSAVIQFKVAALFNVPKKNVVISNPKKYLIPLYEFSFSIAAENQLVVVNAVDGSVKGMDKIPVREKSAVEVTRETLSDLRKPKAWVEYSKGLVSETGKALSKDKESAPSPKGIEEDNAVGKSKLSFLSSKWFLVLIIILALFLIFLAFFN